MKHSMSNNGFLVILPTDSTASGLFRVTSEEEGTMLMENVELCRKDALYSFTVTQLPSSLTVQEGLSLPSGI